MTTQDLIDEREEEFRRDYIEEQKQEMIENILDQIIDENEVDLIKAKDTIEKVFQEAKQEYIDADDTHRAILSFLDL